MKKILLYTIILCGVFSSCKKYLDVVPDNIATIDYAFTLRTSAEKYLFNCFSYMPAHGNFNTNPAMSAGDEVWYMDPPLDVSGAVNFWNIARGQQNASDPWGDYWLGQHQGKNLWIAIRDCNVFLDNIHIHANARIGVISEDLSNTIELKYWSMICVFCHGLLD